MAAKRRLVRRDAEVRDQREAETAANGRPLDGADDGLLGAEEAHGFLVEMAAHLVFVRAIALRVELRAVAEVGARAERLAVGAQHAGADVAVFVEALEGIGDLLDQRHVEEVVRRTLDLDDADVALGRNGDVGELGHGISPNFLLSSSGLSRGPMFSACATA